MNHVVVAQVLRRDNFGPGDPGKWQYSNPVPRKVAGIDAACEAECCLDNQSDNFNFLIRYRGLLIFLPCPPPPPLLCCLVYPVPFLVDSSPFVDSFLMCL